jgi:hypothetical protein
MKYYCYCYYTIYIFLFLFANFVSSSRIQLKFSLKNTLNDINALLNKEISITDENLKVTNYAGILQYTAYNFKLINVNKKENKIAESYFQKTINQTGWDKLSLKTYRGENNTSSFLQSYFGGYLEARLTFIDTDNFLANLEANSLRNDPSSKIIKSIKTFFKNVYESMKMRVQNFNKYFQSDKDRDYYYKIYIFFFQLTGYLEGHNKAVDIYNTKTDTLNQLKKLKIEDLMLIQADGEIPELMRLFNYRLKGKRYRLGEKNYFKDVFNIDESDPEKIWKRLMMMSHCSAMIKIIKDEKNNNLDLFSGHNAWTDYSEMYRTYKQ